MELRVLQYFFGGSTEEQHFRYSGISAPNAAYTVPSAQRVKGKTRKTTFYPGNRRIALTKEGMSLRKRAEEITELVQKASDEIIAYDAMLAGDILIGAGKTDGNRFLIKAIQKEYPLVHFHIESGDKAMITEAIDCGSIDFGIVFGNIDTAMYDSIPVYHQEL